MQLFDQFDMSDVVITLVKLAIGIAEQDDPNLVSLVNNNKLYVNVNVTLYSA